MRANPVVRALTVATALTLATSSVVAAQAQVDTRFPNELGETLVTLVITNALDDSDTNALIERTARRYQEAARRQDHRAGGAQEERQEGDTSWGLQGLPVVRGHRRR